MSVRTLVCKIRARLSGFSARLRRDSAGFAAVEFALIVPVMIIMLLGVVETCEALSVDLRVITIANSTSLLVARCDNITNGELEDVLRISDSLLGKYSSDPLRVQIVALHADAQGVVTVSWSYDRSGGEPYVAGASFPDAPPGLVPSNASAVVSVASYRYASPIGRFIHGAITLKHPGYQATRFANIVKGTTKCTW